MKDWLDKRLAAGGILGRDLKSALGRQLCGWGASPCQTRPWGLSSPGQRCSQGHVCRVLVCVPVVPHKAVAEVSRRGKL